MRFIEELTNIYVRYNRARLKGKSGAEDGAMALATLFDSLAKARPLRCACVLLGARLSHVSCCGGSGMRARCGRA